jgi:hypothetical protein
MHQHRVSWLVISGLLLSAAVSSHAQNVAPNQNFDAGLAPWTQFLSTAPDPSGAGAAPTWLSAIDYTSSSSSGSAQVDINTTQPVGDAASGIAQCVNFVSATSVSLVNYGISVRVPTTTSTDGSINATVEVQLFSGTDCTGFIGGGSQGRDLLIGVASNTTWYAIGDTGFTPPGAPVIAASAQFRAYLREVNGVGPSTTDYKVDFDGARLVLNNTTPVRLQAFEVD